MTVADGLTRREIEAEGELYEVRPPLVGEVLRISRYLEAGTMEGLTLAREVVREWLPDEACRKLFGDTPPEESWRVVVKVMRMGIQTEDPDDVQDRTSADWHTILARYRRAFGLRIEDVLDEPWPLFVGQQKVLSETLARDQIRQAEAFLSGYSGDLSMLYKKAGLDDTAGGGYHREPMDEEARKEKIREIQENRQRRAEA